MQKLVYILFFIIGYGNSNLERKPNNKEEFFTISKTNFFFDSLSAIKELNRVIEIYNLYWNISKDQFLMAYSLNKISANEILFDCQKMNKMMTSDTPLFGNYFFTTKTLKYYINDTFYFSSNNIVKYKNKYIDSNYFKSINIKDSIK